MELLSNDDVDISDIAANIQNALGFKIGWIEEFYSFIGPYLLCVINDFTHEHKYTSCECIIWEKPRWIR